MIDLGIRHAVVLSKNISIGSVAVQPGEPAGQAIFVVGTVMFTVRQGEWPGNAA